MKKLLIVVLVLIAIAAGGPLYTAKLAHDGLQQQVAQMNEMPGYKAELVEYEKGWFNATAKMSIGIDKAMFTGTPNADKIGDLSMLFDLNIAHGPLLLADGVSVGLVSSTGTLNEDNMPELMEFRQQAGLDALMTFQQTTDLLGVSHYSAQVPEFEMSDANGKLAFGGIEVAGDYDLKDNTISAKGTIGEITVAGDGAYVVMKAMEMDFDIEFLNWMVQLGRQNFVMPGIEVFQGSDASGVPVMSMSNIKLLSDASQDTDNTIALKMTLAADSVQGQGMNLQDLNLDFAFEHISLKALEQFVEVYDGAMQNMADPELAQMQMAMGATALAPELLKESPVIAIPDLSFKMNGEPLTANARVEVNAEGLDMAAISANPAPLMQKLTASMNLLVSEGLMQMFGPMMGPQAAMLQKTDKGYELKFDMKDGAATLNGQPLPPLF